MRGGARPAWLATLIGIALAAPAPARDADAPAKQRDPNEIVCEKQEVLGSRLAKRKVCMTRAQWLEHRRADRDMVDRFQVAPCVTGAGC